MKEKDVLSNQQTDCPNQTDAFNKAMENFSNSAVEPAPKKKTGWLGTVFLLVVIAIGIVLMLEMAKSAEGNIKSFDQVIRDLDVKFAVITLGLLLVVMVLESMKYAVVIKVTTGKTSLPTAVKVAFLGKYYDNVTPFASGGQPMQIYYLCKKGYSGGVSTAISFIKYSVNILSWLLVSFVFMLTNSSALDGLEGSASDVLKIFAWIGWAINFCIPLFILLFVIMPKLSAKIVKWVIFVGRKLRIVKDEEKTFAKATKIVDDFRSSFAIMSQRPVYFVLLAVFCLSEITLAFSYPYFVMRSLGLSDEGLSLLPTVIALNAFSAFAVSIVPTPGNSGAAEGVSTIAFSVVAGATLFWSVFAWRFMVFYVYVVIGIGISVGDVIRKIVKNKKNRSNAVNEERK